MRARVRSKDLGPRLGTGEQSVASGPPVELVRGDADSARWEVDVRAVGADGGVVLRGPAVHGKRGERFFYLTWGDAGAYNTFTCSDEPS